MVLLSKILLHRAPTLHGSSSDGKENTVLKLPSASVPMINPSQLRLSAFELPMWKATWQSREFNFNRDRSSFRPVVSPPVRSRKQAPSATKKRFSRTKLLN